jgi:hypothetical protein
MRAAWSSTPRAALSPSRATQAQGNGAGDYTQALHVLTQHLFPPGAGKHAGAFVLTSEPVPEWRGPVDDDDLIRRALNSRSAGAAFGARASFADLWTANVDVLRVAYPSTDKLYGGSARPTPHSPRIWHSGPASMASVSNASCASPHSSGTSGTARATTT